MEELEKAQAEQKQIKKRVPKGTSEYQAAWILSDDEEDKNSYNEDNVFQVLYSNFVSNIYFFLGI
jgi:pre-rRNA-processing protein TSR1